MTDLNTLREVPDLSTLRPGDVIEVHRDDIVLRGPVGILDTSDSGRLLKIFTPKYQILWSSAHYADARVYLVSRPKPPLPTHTGAVLTRAVIRGEEVEGPIILDVDRDWLTLRPVAGCWDHRAKDITDWTVGRVVEADTESE